MSTPEHQQPRTTSLLRPCPACENAVAPDALFCPACGTTLRRRTGPDVAVLAAGVLAVLCGVLLALLIADDDGEPAPATATTAPAVVAPPTTTPVFTPPVTTTPPVVTTPPATTTPPVVTTPPATTTPPAITTPPTQTQPKQ